MRATLQKFYVLRNKLMWNRVSNLVKIAQSFEENLSNGLKNVKIFFSKKNAEFINANDRNYQVLQNLILRIRAKFALINSALICSRINSFP